MIVTNKVIYNLRQRAGSDGDWQQAYKYHDYSDMLLREVNAFRKSFGDHDEFLGCELEAYHYKLGGHIIDGTKIPKSAWLT
jgi:hypothetical protein